MSLRATLWALDDADTDCDTCVLILVAYADHVDEDGCAWPGQQAVARRARCSVRTVRRHLRDLEESGLVTKVDEPTDPSSRGRYLSMRPDHRPTAYVLSLERADRMTGRDDHGRTDGAPRADKPGSHGRTPVSAEPAYEPTHEPLNDDTLGAEAEQVLRQLAERVTPKAPKWTTNHDRMRTEVARLVDLGWTAGSLLSHPEVRDGWPQDDDKNRPGLLAFRLSQIDGPRPTGTQTGGSDVDTWEVEVDEDGRSWVSA